MKPILKVLIADDEETARKRLVRLASAVPGVEICGECSTGEEVLHRVQQGDVDIVLLDIQMPGLSGLDALGLLQSDGPQVIFCTAHAEHAVQAFERGAVDYLLKPIEASRLRLALDRARARAGLRSQEVGGDVQLKRVAVPTRKGILLLNPDAVTHAVLEGALVTIFTTRGQHLTDFSLQDLEDKLPTTTFKRVHRRALLNLAHVTRLEPNEVGGFTAVTPQEHRIEISRAAARALRVKLGLRRAPGGEEDSAEK